MITVLAFLGVVIDVIVDNVGSVAAAAPVYDDLASCPDLLLFGQAEPPTLSQLIERIDIGSYAPHSAPPWPAWSATSG